MISKGQRASEEYPAYRRQEQHRRKSLSLLLIIVPVLTSIISLFVVII